jgi:hypothetical protein
VARTAAGLNYLRSKFLTPSVREHLYQWQLEKETEAKTAQIIVIFRLHHDRGPSFVLHYQARIAFYAILLSFFCGDYR